MTPTIVLNDLPRLDRQSPEWLADSGAVIASLHEQSPFATSVFGTELLSHASVRRALQSREFRPAIKEALLSPPDVPVHVSTFVNDGLLPALYGEQHQRIRKSLATVFTARRIEEQRDHIQATGRRLLADFIETGEADFVDAFTTAYPAQVVSRMIGAPAEDIPMFQQWALTIGHISDQPQGSAYPMVDTAIESLVGYLRDLAAERLADPKDDLISDLVRAQRDDNQMTDDELLYNLVNLLMAGQDTTRLQLASALYLLLANPDQWELLKADPTLAENAVDEAMRYWPAVRWLFRTPLEPAELDGRVFEPGEILVGNFEAANRDPRVFPDPQKYDITRPNAGQQLTFGIGFHHCLGAVLSRTEQAEALRLLASEIPDVTIEDVELRSNAHNFGGAERLDIRFAPHALTGV